MIIVVDAYNLLHAMPQYKKTMTDKERAHFIVQLGTYGRRKGHKMVIVFDGGLHEWPFKEGNKTVTVVYSGMHATADDYIKEYVEAHRAQDLLVVSSDAELNHWAARYNISSIDSIGFFQLLRQELLVDKIVSESQHEIVKMVDEERIGFDQLMIEASKRVPVKSEDVASGGKKRGGKKESVSKHERALLKKLNKL